MQGNLPPEAQEKIEDLQDLQETARQVAMQKQQAETTLSESRAALESDHDRVSARDGRLRSHLFDGGQVRATLRASPLSCLRGHTRA